MSNLCSKCGSREHTTHSGWVERKTIFTVLKCTICGEKQVSKEPERDSGEVVNIWKPK